MSSDDLERIVAATQSSSSVADADPMVGSFPSPELQVAVASAVSNGEPLAVVAVVADLPTLAVLDAIDALHPGTTQPSQGAA